MASTHTGLDKALTRGGIFWQKKRLSDPLRKPNASGSCSASISHTQTGLSDATMSGLLLTTVSKSVLRGIC